MNTHLVSSASELRENAERASGAYTCSYLQTKSLSLYIDSMVKYMHDDAERPSVRADDKLPNLSWLGPFPSPLEGNKGR
jgi:hypothetical protein